MTKVEQVARRVTDSALLAAVARVAMVVAPLLGMPVATWLVSDVMAQGRRVELLATAADDVKRRLDAVERQNQRGSEEAARLAGRFAAIEAALASLAAQQAATLRSVERIERVLDAQRHGR
jgi:Na+/glutamate symporter